MQAWLVERFTYNLLTVEDQELLKKLVIGNKFAWDEFVTRYSDTVYRVALAITKKEEDAQDLVQEVFLALYKNNFQKLRTFLGKSSLKTWISTVASRQCLDFIDQKARYNKIKSRLAELAPEELVGKKQPDPELKEKVRNALAKLNERDRALLSLFYFEEMPYKEIAEILSMPLNSVSPLLMRAKERLERLVGEP